MNNHFYPQMPMGYPQGHPFVPPQPAPPPPGHRHLDYPDVKLDICQEPKEALVTVDGKEKARKPVDPPPVVQLEVTGQADPNQHFLQSPYLFMTCSLISDKDQTPVKTPDGKPALSGSLTSSLHRLKTTDNHGIDGGFFVFGDVSCKVVGVHRLKFCLFDFHKETAEVHFLAEIDSPSFRVVAQKDFRGLDESTYLSRAFSDQGVRLRLRKEPRAFGNGGHKRNYNNYGAIPANQESMRSSQEAPFDFGDDASPPPGAKRHRFNSDTNGTPQHHQYAPSLHQPVRTPESGNSSFPPSAPFNTSAGPFPSSSFDFRHSMAAHSNVFDSANSTSSGAHNHIYNQIPGNHGYPSRNIFETPHQPHGLASYSQSGIQQAMREDQEAAGSLQSLAVQSHGENMSAQSAHLTENNFSGYTINESNFDPTLTGIARPKGRYQERLDNEVQKLESTANEEDGSAQQYQSGPSYFDSHVPVRQQ